MTTPTPFQTIGFVAGATGYTGQAVVRELTNRGARAVAHVRPDSRTLAHWAATFAADGAITDTTPWDEAAIAATLARIRPTHVFALLGTTRARGARGMSGAIADTYDAVDYGLTSLLVRATRAAAPGARFIYLSSLGATKAGGNAYLTARARVERELGESGLAYLVVRPSFITGPDRAESRPAERLSATIADAALMVAGRLGATTLRDRYSSITAADLARGMVRLALEPRAERAVVDSADIRAEQRRISDVPATG